MTRHRWVHIGSTGLSDIFVDYSKRKTKVVSNRYIYIHDGIYPYHDPDYSRRFNL